MHIWCSDSSGLRGGAKGSRRAQQTGSTVARRGDEHSTPQRGGSRVNGLALALQLRRALKPGMTPASPSVPWLSLETLPNEEKESV